MKQGVVGFSLIELIFVIMVIGVTSVMLMPKWPATGLGVNYEAQHVLNDIRYAQGLSQTTGLRYRWVMLSATTYSIYNEAGSAIVLPRGNTVVTLADGVTFGTLTNLPNSLIAFDATGAPYTTSVLPGTLLAATASIPLTRDSVTRTVQILAVTGFGAVA